MILELCLVNHETGEIIYQELIVADSITQAVEPQQVLRRAADNALAKFQEYKPRMGPLKRIDSAQQREDAALNADFGTDLTGNVDYG